MIQFSSDPRCQHCGQRSFHWPGCPSEGTPVKRRAIPKMSKKRQAALPSRARVVAEVKRRDGNRCQAAIRLGEYDVPLSNRGMRALPVGCSGPLDVHEIIPRSAWAAGWLEVSNAITVCRAHHDWIGDHPMDAHWVGLHRFSWERPPIS